jgi:hypothetical protein
VFGLAAGSELRRAAPQLKDLLDLGASTAHLAAAVSARNLGRLTTWQRFVEVRDRADE